MRRNLTFAEYKRMVQSTPDCLQPKTLSTTGGVWEGTADRKPWDYDVTAAIPVHGSPEIAAMCVKLLLAQTEAPYVVLIDTGSDPEDFARIEALRSDQVEVHTIRANGWRHPSDPVASAMDLAFSVCRSPYLYATHSDCFARRRDLLAELIALSKQHSPVVGYRLSPRHHPDWKLMVGHTCTMFDMAVMDRINATWCIRRLCRAHNIPWHPNACGPGWPDTELLTNYQTLAAGIVPHFVGFEQNFERTLDENIDHFRSFTSSRMYSPEHHSKCKAWKTDAMRAAAERLAEWEAADAGA